MNKQISENTPISTMQKVFDDAKARGLRIEHRPDPVKSNVVSLDAKRQMMAHTSPEAA